MPIDGSSLKLSYVVSKDFSKSSLTLPALALYQQINTRLKDEAEFDAIAFEQLLAHLKATSDSPDRIKTQVLPYISGYLQFLYMELLTNEKITYVKLRDAMQKLLKHPLFFYQATHGLVIINMSPKTGLNVFQLSGFAKYFSEEILQAIFERYTEAVETDDQSISCELINLFKQGPIGSNYLEYIGRDSNFTTVANVQIRTLKKISQKQ